RDLPLLLGDLLELALGVLDVALRPLRLVLLQAPLRFLDSLEGFLRPRGRGRIAAGGRLPHGIGRRARVARRLLEILALLLARQALEPPGRFFDLLGEGALLRAAGAAAHLPLERA